MEDRDKPKVLVVGGGHEAVEAARIRAKEIGLNVVLVEDDTEEAERIKQEKERGQKMRSAVMSTFAIGTALANTLPQMPGGIRSARRKYSGPTRTCYPRVPHEESYINAGQSDINQKWYAALMVFKEGGWVKGWDSTVPYDDADSAKRALGKQMPHIPIWFHRKGQDHFEYPFYTFQMKAAEAIQLRADEKRRRRAEKQQLNAERSEANKYNGVPKKGLHKKKKRGKR